MKRTILSLLLLSSLNAQSQDVTIPDANFKNYLVNNALINTNGDTEIQVSEATAFTGTIGCNNLSISDITGIEAFVNLYRLECNDNQISTIDISSNTMLEIFNCRNNQISSLDVSANTALTYLGLGENAVTDLNVSNNLSLNRLDCFLNEIGTLDISLNTVLTELYCYDNQLTSLNLANGNNANIVNMDAKTNALTCIQHDGGFNPNSNPSWEKDLSANWSDNCPPPCVVTIPDANFKSYLVGNAAININGNTEIECSEANAFIGPMNCSGLSIADLTGIESFTSLTQLVCYANDLTNVDLTLNLALTHLDLSQNLLTDLDVSENINLGYFDCVSNQLTSLNLANGNNSNLDDMYGQSNNLTCIQHDAGFDPTTNNGWLKDATASWSDDCVLTIGGADGIKNIQIYPNPSAGIVHIVSEDNIESVIILNGIGQVVHEVQSTFSLDLSAFPKGVYFMKIVTSNSSITRELYLK